MLVPASSRSDTDHPRSETGGTSPPWTSEYIGCHVFHGDVCSADGRLGTPRNLLSTSIGIVAVPLSSKQERSDRSRHAGPSGIGGNGIHKRLRPVTIRGSSPLSRTAEGRIGVLIGLEHHDGG